FFTVISFFLAFFCIYNRGLDSAAQFRRTLDVNRGVGRALRTGMSLHLHEQNNERSLCPSTHRKLPPTTSRPRRCAAASAGAVSLPPACSRSSARAPGTGWATGRRAPLNNPSSPP